jgi:hypothetical protein
LKVLLSRRQVFRPFQLFRPCQVLRVMVDEVVVEVVLCQRMYVRMGILVRVIMMGCVEIRLQKIETRRLQKILFLQQKAEYKNLQIIF